MKQHQETCLHTLQHFRFVCVLIGLVCTVSLPGPWPRLFLFQIWAWCKWVPEYCKTEQISFVTQHRFPMLPTFLNSIFLCSLDLEKITFLILVISTKNYRHKSGETMTNGNLQKLKDSTNLKPQRLNGCLVSSHDGSFPWNASWPRLSVVIDGNFSGST